MIHLTVLAATTNAHRHATFLPILVIVVVVAVAGYFVVRARKRRG